MAPGTIDRRLFAILSADVVGYSRLMGADETGTLSALQAHREDLIDPTIAGIVQPELQRPTPDSLIRDINAAFGEQVLHITVTERKPEIQPDDMLNDLWRKSCRA